MIAIYTKCTFTTSQLLPIDSIHPFSLRIIMEAPSPPEFQHSTAGHTTPPANTPPAPGPGTPSRNHLEDGANGTADKTPVPEEPSSSAPAGASKKKTLKRKRGPSTKAIDEVDKDNVTIVAAAPPTGEKGIPLAVTVSFWLIKPE